VAHVYVYSGAAGTGTGASWVNAYTTLSAALTAKAAGDNFWVAHDHAESSASPNLQSNATASAPCTVICVNRAGTVPPVSADYRTTATITASGGTDMRVGFGADYIFYRGITFIVGAANITVGASASLQGYFQSCTFKCTASGRASFLNIGTGVGAHVIWDNTGVDVAGTDVAVTVASGAHLLWKNTATPVATTFPNRLIYSNTGSAVLDGVDLSAAGFSGNYIGQFSTYGDGTITLKNCKTHSGLLQTLTDPGINGAAFYVINSDSSGTNYRNEKKTYQGSQVPETTIVRTGGASDGTTPVSTKIVTGADAKYLFPFEAEPLTVFNPTTASNVTVTVYGIWGGGAVPNNDDIWIEVVYMGSSGSPISTLNISNAKADFLATATAQASDSSTWGGSTTKFKMAVTLSSPQPGLTGLFYVYPRAAKASSTFYVDPKAVLS
jgi:hypothetical protein